jgi:hypothetical protein
MNDNQQNEEKLEEKDNKTRFIRKEENSSKSKK